MFIKLFRRAHYVRYAGYQRHFLCNLFGIIVSHYMCIALLFSFGEKRKKKRNQRKKKIRMLQNSALSDYCSTTASRSLRIRSHSLLLLLLRVSQALPAHSTQNPSLEFIYGALHHTSLWLVIAPERVP